jgi:hypothetical protein
VLITHRFEGGAVAELPLPEVIRRSEVIGGDEWLVPWYRWHGCIDGEPVDPFERRGDLPLCSAIAVRKPYRVPQATTCS